MTLPVGNKNKWYSLKRANRIPALQLEKELDVIRRNEAFIKREARLEETEIWQYLFDNHRFLRRSLAREGDHQDVLGRTPRANNAPLSQMRAEEYRQFIIFKARTMRKVFGDEQMGQRPKYRQLYEREVAPHRNNVRSMQELIVRFQYLRALSRDRGELMGRAIEGEFPLQEEICKRYSIQLPSIKNDS